MIKALIALIPLMFFATIGIALEKNIETNSVELENLISFYEDI